MEILKGDFDRPNTSIWHYKLDNAQEVEDASMWLKANPNLGKTVSYETYKLDVERAKKVPAAKNDIFAKRFGLPMEGYTYFFTYEETIPHINVRRGANRGGACSLGVDLSQGDDFCAFTFLFPLRNGKFSIDTRSYITKRTLDLLPGALRAKYQEFLDEGSLVVMEGTVLDMMEVYEDLAAYIQHEDYEVRALGYDTYNAKEFMERWVTENSEWGVVKVIQGARTESVPLGEIKILAEDRLLVFYQVLMMFTMGNAIVIEDTNGNRKLSKKRKDEKIDNVSALMDAYVAYKANKEEF